MNLHTEDQNHQSPICISGPSWERAVRMAKQLEDTIFTLLPTGMSTSGYTMSRMEQKVQAAGPDGLTLSEFTRAFQEMKPKITKNKELYEQLCKLLQQRGVYDIVCALRGPDGSADGAPLVKCWTAARLRGLLGLSEYVVGAVFVCHLDEEGAEIIDGGLVSVGFHYLRHYEAACRAFKDLFGYDPSEVHKGGKLE